MYKNNRRKSADLFRGLSVLKEEIVDKKTNSVCTVGKAWGVYLNMFEKGKDTTEILEEIDNRFPMEYYQYNILMKLAKCLDIVSESIDHHI
jgi:hypothetical protein